MTTEALPDHKYCGYCGNRLNRKHNAEACLVRARERAVQSASDKARPKCCCQMGCAVKGEFPEFDCTDCPVHKAGLGAHEHRCGKHKSAHDNAPVGPCCCYFSTIGAPGCVECPKHGEALNTYSRCYQHIF